MFKEVVVVAIVGFIGGVVANSNVIDYCQHRNGSGRDSKELMMINIRRTPLLTYGYFVIELIVVIEWCLQRYSFRLSR